MRHCLPAPSLTRDNAFKTRAEIETNCYTRGYHPLWLSCEVYPFSQEAPYKDLCAAAQRRYSDFSNTVPRKCRIRRDNRGGIREMHVKKRKSQSPTASHQRIRSYTGHGLLFACVLLSASLSVPRKKGFFMSEED